jgi:hypothetical protein
MNKKTFLNELKISELENLELSLESIKTCLTKYQNAVGNHGYHIDCAKQSLTITTLCDYLPILFQVFHI